MLGAHSIFLMMIYSIAYQTGGQMRLVVHDKRLKPAVPMTQLPIGEIFSFVDYWVEYQQKTYSVVIPHESF